MKILLTGATGYIGKRLLPVLVDNDYEVLCCVRDKNRFSPEKSLLNKIEVLENDLTDKDSLNNIPADIDIAFYLVHSMSASKNYDDLEQQSAVNFRNALNKTNIKQCIYLSGMVNSDKLSKHLSSRKLVEEELGKGSFSLTSLRAGIIIGSGSASFEIIRDLVEKLPFMLAPKWLNTKCQPIAISDVLQILLGVINRKETFNKSFDIAGKDILTYKQMLLEFASERRLKRYILTIPVLTPRLSSYWLFFVTSTTFRLASALVDSMKTEVVAKDLNLIKLLDIKTLSYGEAVKRAFKRIEQNEIISSWKDSTISGRLNYHISEFLNVPRFGCFKDIQSRQISNIESCKEKIWRIGGNKGWYYANWLWRIRGITDKLAGGVGLRRGRTSADKINAGDTLDFWRVLYADKKEGRLLLFAEMKLPGEAWLEFRIADGTLIQTATFRPRGLMGRLYWLSVFPFHGFIFKGLIKKLTM